MPLIFREQIEEKDLPVLRQLVTATGFFTEAEIAVAVELAEDNLHKKKASDYRFLLAEEAGTLLGYTCYGHITITQSAYDLYWIVVSPECQGRGIGKQLITATENNIRKADGTRLFAETSSQPKYVSTRQFYEKSGFAQEATVRDFYAPGDNKLIYARAL
jgi:ribosomal protein S18 acetylase RimI-like enzyme